MTNQDAKIITDDDYGRFFEEAVTALRVLPSGGTYGGTENQVEGENRALHLLQELHEKKNEAAEFSPELTVLPLTLKKFAERNLSLPVGMRDLMKHNDFYHIRFPITVMPRPGFLFWRLMCVVDINPGAPSPRPKVTSVFPSEEWQTIIEAYQGGEFGIDENCQFNVDVDWLKDNPLPAKAQAAIDAKLHARASLTLGKFKYHVQRPLILARGKDTPTVRWTLDGKERFKSEDLQLGIVLQVPKSVETVHISGALLAYRQFDSMMAEMKDIWERIQTYLSKETREYFDKGAPLPHSMNWANVTQNF